MMKQRLWTEGEDILNYVNGCMQPAAKGAWLENVNPSTGQIMGRFPDSDASESGKRPIICPVEGLTFSNQAPLAAGCMQPFT